jgi:hypothetical protein
MTMTGRFVNHGICILAAVALLLAVMASPFRPTRASHPAPSPNYLPRNFAFRKSGHSGKFAMLARLSLTEADSLPSEMDADIEDEPTVTSLPASASLDVLPSPCPEPYSELVDFAVALAARPLRC